MAGSFTRAALAALAAFLGATPLAAQEAVGERDRYAFTQDYEPSPALWRLADEDTTIYLLGTIHVLPRGFRWRSEQLEQIIDEAEVLVVETSNYDIPADGVDVGGKMMDRIARRVPTSVRLSAPARENWAALIGLTGLDFETVDNMPVLLALLTMGMTGNGEDPASVAYGVETVLESEFIERERPIESIEDSGEVMYSLLRLDSDDLVEELDQRLAAWDGKTAAAFYDNSFERASGDAYWADEHAWARGIVQEEFDLGFGDGPIGRAFDEMLLDRRNTEWAEWLDERLEEPGTILVAVGSGHFEGDVSLLVKLEERGLTAERLN